MCKTDKLWILIKFGGTCHI